MRTLIALLVSSALAVAVVYAAHWIGIGRTATLATFLTLWLIACVLDAQRGIRAGYAVPTEASIHALLFVVPAAIATLLARSWLQ